MVHFLRLYVDILPTYERIFPYDTQNGSWECLE